MVNIVSALFAIVCAVSCLSVSHAGGAHTFAIRFPGPANIKALPKSVLQRQTSAAPYPPAGIQPQPPFELPTEQAASFPDEPELIYGPPVDEEPVLIYGPPADEDTSSNLPQSASILQSDVISPRTQFALPAPQRLTAFRPSRLQPNRRVKPAKIIVGAPLPKLPKDIVTPLTQLVPPLVERLNVFKRQKKVIVGGFLQPGGLASLKPTINNLLTPLTQLVPPLVERLNVFKKAKKNVIVGLLPNGLAAKPPLSSVLAQLTPAVKKPVIVGGRIIGYSDRSQNW